MLGDGGLGLRYCVLGALPVRWHNKSHGAKVLGLLRILTPTDRVRGDQKLGQSLCKNFSSEPKELGFP